MNVLGRHRSRPSGSRWAPRERLLTCRARSPICGPDKRVAARGVTWRRRPFSCRGARLRGQPRDPAMWLSATELASNVPVFIAATQPRAPGGASGRLLVDRDAGEPHGSPISGAPEISYVSQRRVRRVPEGSRRRGPERPLRPHATHHPAACRAPGGRWLRETRPAAPFDGHASRRRTGFRWSDVDTERQSLCIRRSLTHASISTPKSAARSRTIKLMPGLRYPRSSSAPKSAPSSTRAMWVACGTASDAEHGGAVFGL